MTDSKSISSMIRPIVLKIIPYDVAKKIKRLIVANARRKLKKAKVKPFSRLKYKDGINLIGDIKAASGLGQSIRLLESSIDGSGIDSDIFYYNTMGGDQAGATSDYDDRITNDLQYNVNIIHINPAEFGIAFQRIKRSTFDHRYNIAYWLWELEDFPDEWISCLNVLDEVWAPSEFICEAVRKKTDLPVRCVPYAISSTSDDSFSRADYGLPEDAFLFLAMYDSNSCAERKNPKGILRAFGQAFDKDDKSVGLVMKINHCRESDLDNVQSILAGYSNVYVIRETFSKEKTDGLVSCADAIVSMHRAEGFGLVLAEAMINEKPVIATNWSSNTEFMNKDCACMLDFKLITMDQDYLPYTAGNRWADPDIDQAAEYMVRLRNDKEYYRRMAVAGKKHVSEVLKKERIVKLIENRINEIYDEQNKRDI